MKLWPMFLGLWLILNGLMSIADLSFRYDDLVIGLIAVIAGVLVIVRK